MSLRFLKKRQRRQPFWFWVLVLSFVFLVLFLFSGRLRDVFLPEKEIKISEDLVFVKLWDVESTQLLK